MMTGADRQRSPILFAAVAVLALSGAVLGLLFSPLQAQEGTAPDKPRGLEATATHDSVTLTWDDPQDDSITGYMILRRNRDTGRKGEFRELVADTGTAATTYPDDTVSAETRYTYRIKAINEHGVSERSRWFHIDTPRTPRSNATRDHTPSPSVPEGGTDLPNNDTSPGVVAVGDSVAGKLESNNDRDRFKVELLKGVTYQIDMEGRASVRGTLGDPKMSLRMPDGEKHTNDAGGISGNARFEQTWAFDEPGWIEAYRGGGTSNRIGTYKISVIVLGSGRSETSSDFLGNKNTSGRLDVGASATGWVERDGRDWFRVELIEGRVYHFDVEGADTDRGSLDDPKLWGVFDEAGDEIPGNRSNARVTFTADYTGRHFVSAGREGDDPNQGSLDSERTYTISARYQDFLDNVDTTATVRPDGVGVTGSIDFSDDVDWYAVELEVPRSYQVDLEGEDTDHGTLGNPVIRGIYDASGSWISGSRDDNDGDGQNARVNFRARASGTYYVAATAGSGMGTYTLSVRPQPLDLYPANTTTSGVVEVGGRSRGFISRPVTADSGTSFDSDWFKVELAEDRTYRIEMKGAILTGPGKYADPENTLRLPQINAIYGRHGNQLVNTFSSDESSSHHLFRVTFHAHRNGTHYIAASGESFEWGGYELRVKDITEDD